MTKATPHPANPTQHDDKLDDEEQKILTAYEAGKTTRVADAVPLPERTMTAAQALAGLPLPILMPQQTTAWLKDSKDDFGNAVPEPWA